MKEPICNEEPEEPAKRAPEPNISDETSSVHGQHLNSPELTGSDMKEPAAAVLLCEPADESENRGTEPDASRDVHVASQSNHHGIYWRSPTLMVSYLVFGLLFSLGHHLFYMFHKGRIVSSTDEQQWNIRMGSVFAWIIQILLTGCVWIGYTQWLWKSLKIRPISLSGLDAAFSAETSLWSLFHFQLVINAPVCAFLGLIAWALQIATVITPATLSVVLSSKSMIVQTNVQSLNIANAASSREFAYFVPTNVMSDWPNANNDSQTFDGARSILTRLSTATASMGEILNVHPPFDHCSYRLKFAAPYVQCTAANMTVQHVVEAVLQAQNASWAQSELAFLEAYYAFVPSHESDVGAATVVTYEGMNYTALDQPRLQGRPMNASNEVWIKYYQFDPDENNDGILDRPADQQKASPIYSVCSLWNASYDLELSFRNGEQNVSSKSIDLLEEVNFPTTNPNTATDLVQLAYSAVFLVLADQLVGRMGIFVNSTTGDPQYGSIATNIEHNSLLGSDSLDYFFYLNSRVNPNHQQRYKPQRLADKALARNQTLPFLVQESSFNVTTSLLANPILTAKVEAAVNRTVPVNRYSYSARNLWAAYGPANSFALCAMIAGMYAFRTNGASHNSAFSTLLSIGRDSGLDPLFPPCCHGKQPLPKETMATKVQISRQSDGVENLVPSVDGTIKPVCRTCQAQASAVMSPVLGRRRLSSFTGWRRRQS